MPNQRSKNKTYLGGFLNRELHEQIVRQAKKAGMADNKFGFATLLIQESLARRQKRQRAAKSKSLST